MELRQPKPLETAASQISLLGSAIRHVGRVEQSILMIGALLAGFVWGFVELAAEVVEGGTEALDRALLLALRGSAASIRIHMAVEGGPAMLTGGARGPSDHIMSVPKPCRLW